MFLVRIHLFALLAFFCHLPLRFLRLLDIPKSGAIKKQMCEPYWNGSVKRGGRRTPCQDRPLVSRSTSPCYSSRSPRPPSSSRFSSAPTARTRPLHRPSTCPTHPVVDAGFSSFLQCMPSWIGTRTCGQFGGKDKREAPAAHVFVHIEHVGLLGKIVGPNGPSSFRGRVLFLLPIVSHRA